MTRSVVLVGVGGHGRECLDVLEASIVGGRSIEVLGFVVDWTEVHAVADEDHSDIFEPIFVRHIDSEAAAQAVLAATRDGLVIDRALRGANE